MERERKGPPLILESVVTPFGSLTPFGSRKELRLIDEAIARNPVPFARGGGGSVVIPAKPRRQRRLNQHTAVDDEAVLDAVV